MANSTLYRTNTAPSASGYKYTFSAWVKRSKITERQQFWRVLNPSATTYYSYLEFQADDKLHFNDYSSNGTLDVATNRLFRDTSAWYHIMAVVDTTQGTASDRIKLYINGAQETSLVGTTYSLGQNQATTGTESGKNNYVGGDLANNTRFFNGYMSHVSFVDGQALAPTVFGQTDSTSGIWKFKSSSGVTWGNNGYNLKFENSGNLGLDSSGEGHNLTVSGNLTQTVDTPSINWVTFNPLCNSGSGQVTYSRANTRGGTGGGASFLNMMPNSGKWFMEFHFNAAGAGQDNGIGFWSVDEAQRIAFYAGGFKGIVWKYAGNVYVNGSNNAFSSNTFTSGDIISVAMDMDNSTATFYKNGSVATNLNAYSFPFTERQAITVGIIDGASASSEDGIFDFNSGANPTFGGRKTAGGNADGNSQGNFSMAVPSGYYALNTKNINTYG